MSDNDGKKTLGLRGSRPGQVKQSFSHGRTKNVVVETKRKRVVVPKPGAAAGGAASPTKGDPRKRPAGITDAEMERRLKRCRLPKPAKPTKRPSVKPRKRPAKKSVSAVARKPKPRNGLNVNAKRP